MIYIHSTVNATDTFPSLSCLWFSFCSLTELSCGASSQRSLSQWREVNSSYFLSNHLLLGPVFKHTSKPHHETFIQIQHKFSWMFYRTISTRVILVITARENSIISKNAIWNMGNMGKIKWTTIYLVYCKKTKVVLNTFGRYSMIHDDMSHGLLLPA